MVTSSISKNYVGRTCVRNLSNGDAQLAAHLDAGPTGACDLRDFGLDKYIANDNVLGVAKNRSKGNETPKRLGVIMIR